MDTIQINKEFIAIVAVLESQSTDTVTYTIYKASDGSIFAQGSCVYVAGINWKVAFTPLTFDVFIVEVKDQTLDVVYSQSFQVEAEEDDAEPTTQELLTSINKAIKARLSGGAVQAYSIGGRNLQYMSIKELYDLRDKLRMEVNAQKGPARNVGGFRRNQTGGRNYQDFYGY